MTEEQWCGTEKSAPGYSVYYEHVLTVGCTAGAFGQQMEVRLVNDGPVTVPLDSLNPKSKPYTREQA